MGFRRPALHHDQPETFGQRLARLRRHKGITQVQLARRLKVSQAMISDYERDNLRLHADVIVALTKILDVSADELLGIRPSPRMPVGDRRFLPELTAIDQLPKRDKEALLRTIRLYTAKVRAHSSERSHVTTK